MICITSAHGSCCCAFGRTRASTAGEIDETKLAALAYDGNWRTPELRHNDGSVADW